MCKEYEEKEKIRKVFLDDLPTKEGIGNNKGKLVIDWENSVGYIVNFIYDDIKGEFEIINYEKNGQKLYIKYKDYPIYKIYTSNLVKYKLEGILKNELLIMKYDIKNPRRIDFRQLPLNSHGINWEQVALNKMNIPFVYDGIEGEFTAVQYEKDKHTLHVKYKDNPIFKIATSNLIKCGIQGLLKKEILVPLYDEKSLRRVDLRSVPLNGTGVDWNKVVEEKIKIPFVYKNISGEIDVVSYDGKYLEVKYLDYKPHKINTGNFSKCGLGKMLNEYSSDYKIQLNSVFEDENRYIKIIKREHRKQKRKNGYIEDKKWYRYHCNKCGYEGWVIEGALLQGNGCSCCANRTVVEGINDIPTTAPWMIKFFQGGYDEAKKYTKNSNQKIHAICPDCGRVKDKPISISKIFIRHTISCTCGDGISYPEKIMFNLLEQLMDNKFEYQYSPKWAKPMRYDFYFELNDKKYVIEMDGGLGHGRSNTLSGKSDEESKLIDNQKDILAEKHNIKVIRIDCIKSELEYIKTNTLQSELINILDLNSINWNKAEAFALNNRVKEACELKRNNPDLTTGEISKIMKMCQQSIIRYLKQGSKIGWCLYNTQEEQNKNNIKSAQKIKEITSKPIEIFKNGISLGTFKSGRELSDKSEQLFGIKMDFRGISQVSTGKRKQYKGYTFKQVGKIA